METFFLLKDLQYDDVRCYYISIWSLYYMPEEFFADLMNKILSQTTLVVSWSGSLSVIVGLLSVVDGCCQLLTVVVGKYEDRKKVISKWFWCHMIESTIQAHVLLSHRFFKRASGILQSPPSIRLSPPKPLDEIQPNLVCELLTWMGPATALFFAPPPGALGRGQKVKYH